MNLKTNRLEIRNIKEEDWENIRLIVNDFECSEYAVYDGQFPREEEVFKKVIKRFVDSNLFFGVFLIGSEDMIGYVNFHNNDGIYDLGYSFKSEYKGKGYGFESCEVIIKYIKENFEAKGFSAGTALENIPSCKLLEKLGFILKKTEEMSFHKDDIGNDITFNGGEFLLNN